MSFLVIDIGNTRLKWAVYAEAAPEALMLGSGAAVLEDIDDLGQGHWRGMPAPDAMLGCAVAGEAIRRRVDEQIVEAWGLRPQWAVAQRQAAGVVNGYDHPHRLGADRWAALVGARGRLSASPAAPGATAALVVMVGTAVTVDALDASGRFLGGLILPGFGLMLRALEIGTAGLKVPMGEVHDFPSNTSDALMSGGADAIAGAVERMHARLAERCGGSPRVILSGGAASKLATCMRLPFETAETLVFEGLLRLAAEASGATTGCSATDPRCGPVR